MNQVQGKNFLVLLQLLDLKRCRMTGTKPWRFCNKDTVKVLHLISFFISFEKI